MSTTTSKRSRLTKRVGSSSPRRMRFPASKQPNELLALAREARRSGPVRVRLADGDVITVTAEPPPRARKASASATNLRQLLLDSPLADLALERHPEYSPVRDVEP